MSPTRGASPAELARALARWQHAAGPFWPYVCAAPFLGDIAPAGRPTRPPAPWRPAEAVLASAGGPVALFVDLPPLATLAAAPALSGLGFAVVPVVQRWAAAPAVLPCAALRIALAESARLVRRPARPRGLVFLLDGERAGPATDDRAPGPRAFDNRYSYRVCRFPPAGLLLREGLGLARWVAPRGPAADLQPYLGSLLDGGVRLELADG